MRHLLKLANFSSTHFYFSSSESPSYENCPQITGYGTFWIHVQMGSKSKSKKKRFLNRCNRNKQMINKCNKLGITRVDRIRNESIRGTAEVEHFGEKEGQG